jgi:hypothetical protein
VPRALFLCLVLIAAATAARPASAAVLTLPPDAGAPSGVSAAVPLTIDVADGIIGATIEISYDATVARATGVTQTPLSSSHSLFANLDNPGQIRIALFGSMPLSGGGALLMISFQSVGGTDSRTLLDLTRASLNEGQIPSSLQDGAWCVQGTPGEVADMQAGLAADGVTVVLSWSAAPFAMAYDVYRGSRPDLADLACFRPGVGAPPVTDPGIPPVDGLFVYLVASRNCRGSSGLGTDSAGVPRPLPAPCP